MNIIRKEINRLERSEAQASPMKKENRGGFRKNSGRKLKYGEQTVPVTFACPVSKVTEIKQLIKTALGGLMNP